MATESNHKEFSKIILKSFLDDEVVPERAAEIFGFFPHDILTFVALTSSELARLVHHFYNEVVEEIAKASLTAIDKVTTQSYGEAVLQPIFLLWKT
jgi:hypothetical protein